MPDTFHHPTSEDELVALVKRAYREGRQLRVRGAAHSPAHAIYTDPPPGFPNQVDVQEAPPGDGINVMLDRYREWRVIDEQQKLVEADAGIHLGDDPSDPTGTASLEKSLLWQLWNDKHWTLSDTGGITHQTVSGFASTGSAGGSFTHSLSENLWAIRIIDGRGNVEEISRQKDPDRFCSLLPGFGLLGVISKIVFKCVDTFDIEGQEAVTRPEDCAVDIFGPGSGGRDSLADFLRKTEFARIEWWPQRGCERVLVWQAKRLLNPGPEFIPRRYEEFTKCPELAEFGISVIYAVLANLNKLSRARRVLAPAYRQLSNALASRARRRLGPVGAVAARALAFVVRVAINLAITLLLTPLAPLLRRNLPGAFSKLLGVFVPLNSQKRGKNRSPQRFEDWAWQGLPMDNQAIDVLLPEAFMEMWFPLARTQDVMKTLDRYFRAPKDARAAFDRTGIDAWELYCTGPSCFWLSPSYTDGTDEWAGGAFRVDAYWYQGSPEDPTTSFYPQFWELFEPSGIPFRLHWGKHQPPVAAGDRKWVNYFAAQYPRWDEFLRLREQRDPNNIFLTRYWRDRFGLWSDPGPRAAGAPAPSPPPPPQP